MKLLLLLVSAFAVGYADDHEECKAAFVGYANCIKEKHGSLIEDMIATAEEKVEEIRTCFTEQCPFPEDFSAHPPKFLPDEGLIDEEGTACIKKKMWQHRVDQLEQCYGDAPAFIYEGMKEVQPHHSVKHIGHFRENVEKLKNKAQECEESISKEHADEIRQCVRSHVEPRMKSHMEKRCEIGQQCADEHFDGNWGCVRTAKQHKEEMCDCWRDKIVPSVLRNFKMMYKGRDNWTDEEDEEMTSFVQPFANACGVEMPVRRRRRHYRRRGHSHSDSSSGSSEVDPKVKSMMKKPAPIFCQCDIKIPEGEGSDDGLFFF